MCGITVRCAWNFSLADERDNGLGYDESPMNSQPHPQNQPLPEPRSKPLCLETDALAVLKHLRKSGHVAYFAGGCVRDRLLGLTPKDWDIATDAPPPRVRELFADTQAVGAAFGVILVRNGQSVVEVATFRSDGPYADGRRPANVRFASAEEDAQRRDFTINGLFYDPLEDRVIDYVKGQEDLQRRVLRAIGDAKKRFGEDHLRLLRAVRFAARFELTIDPTTSAAMRDAAPQLKGISPERIGDEVRWMLTPITRNVAWRLLWEHRLAEVIFRFLPKLPQTPPTANSIFLSLAPGQMITFGLAMAAAAICIRRHAENGGDLGALLAGKEVTRSEQALRQALRLSNDESDEFCGILNGLQAMLTGAPPGIAAKKRFLARPTSGTSRQLMESIAAVGLHRQRIEELRPQLAELENQELSPAPLISGDDLTAAGFSPGPAYKRILDALYDAQLEGRISTRDQAMGLARSLNAQTEN
jgi:poly(A) polymerase